MSLVPFVIFSRRIDLFFLPLLTLPAFKTSCVSQFRGRVLLGQAQSGLLNVEQNSDSKTLSEACSIEHNLIRLWLYVYRVFTIAAANLRRVVGHSNDKYCG